MQWHHAIRLTQRVDDVVLAVGRLDLEDRDRAALQRRGVRMVEGSIERLEYSHDQLQGVRSADELEPATKVIVFPAPRPWAYPPDVDA